MIEQWGTATANDPTFGALPSVNFPIPFTDLNSINIQVTAPDNSASAVDGNKVGGKALSITQFQLYSDDNSKTVKWRAIGR